MESKRKTKIILWAALPLIILYAFTARFEFKFNVSESLDGNLFLIDKWNKEIKKGKKISFAAEGNGYYQGEFLKIIKGVEGDKVVHDDSAVYINNEYVGIIKERGRNGDLLQAGPTGIIPKGECFVAGKHKDSFDSRYKNIGYVKKNNIIGTAYLIF